MARILFDLDGTLVDSAPSLCHAGNALLAHLGRKPVDVETYKGFVGRGMPRQIEQLLTNTGGVPGGELAPHLARFRAVYDADPLIKTVAYPGVPEALEALKAAGHLLEVCTQKAGVPARKVLSGLGLDGTIEGFTGGDSLDVLKPDPAMLWHAAAQIGEGPILFVGDTIVDAETARRASVPFLLHTPGYRQEPVEALDPAATFDDWSTLPDLVFRLLAPAA